MQQHAPVLRDRRRKAIPSFVALTSSPGRTVRATQGGLVSAPAGARLSLACISKALDLGPSAHQEPWQRRSSPCAVASR